MNLILGSTQLSSNVWGILLLSEVMHGWHAMFQNASSKVWPDTRSDLTAIALECINVIIPFDVIRQKYPGGLAQRLLDRRGSIVGKWAYLVR